jgi:hypothetical protein
MTAQRLRPRRLVGFAAWSDRSSIRERRRADDLLLGPDLRRRGRQPDARRRHGGPARTGPRQPRDGPERERGRARGSPRPAAARPPRSCRCRAWRSHRCSWRSRRPPWSSGDPEQVRPGASTSRSPYPPRAGRSGPTVATRCGANLSSAPSASSCSAYGRAVYGTERSSARPSPRSSSSVWASRRHADLRAARGLFR